MRLLFLVLTLFICIALADIGVQSDWSGGPGEEGSVTDWGNSFFSSILVNWFDGENLLLEQMASYNQIRQFSDLEWAKPCHLDNDNYPDIFVTDGDDGTKWYRNTSSGSNWGERDFADTREIVDIATGDVDGDGDYDVFASVDFYPNNGFFWYERLTPLGSQWEKHEIDSEDYPDRVFSIDVDGDGDLDLIGSYSNTNLSWWENQNSGQNWIKHIISENILEQPISSIDVSDFDNDGDLDIACGSQSNEIYLFINQGNNAWNFQGIEYVSGGSMHTVIFADIDGDDLEDMVTVASSTSDLLWFRNTGNPNTWSLHQVPIDILSLWKALPGDIDGDGDFDIVVIGANAYPFNKIYWLENIDSVAGNWIHHEAFSDSLGYGHCIADINLNGECDVVCYYEAVNKVAWWDFNSGFFATETAQLESSILYVYDVTWGNIDWSAITPEGTSVSFEVRSSDDPEDMGDWSAVISSPGSLSPYLTSNDSYVQYRVNLLATDSTVTPVLQNVALSWTTTGIEGSENTENISLCVLQNPSAGSVRFGVNLPSQFNVTLTVYDAAGRLVSNVADTEYSAGTTVVQLDLLQPGIYFCRLQADEQSLTEQFTIIGD